MGWRAIAVLAAQYPGPVVMQPLEVDRVDGVLKGFQKVTLAPGQNQQITFQLTPQDMSYYQTATSSWVVAPGIYRVSIGSNERDLAVSGSFFAG